MCQKKRKMIQEDDASIRRLEDNIALTRNHTNNATIEIKAITSKQNG